MIRFLTLLLLSQALAQAELLTRAYFIGKDQLWKWSDEEYNQLVPNPDNDPFGGSSDEDITAPRPEPLKSPPFESKLFREGDVLYDFKVFKKQLEPVQGQLAHLIYNSTTGRMIVKGEASTHWLFHSLAIRNAEESPQTIELAFDFLEDNQTIFATTHRTLPGQTTLLETGQKPNRLKIETEAHTYYEDNYTECRLVIDGLIRNQAFKLDTGLVLVNGIPSPIELGKTNPKEKPLTLYITAHAILHGDVRKSDLILDENARPVTPGKGFNAHHKLYQDGIKDPETGLLFKAYRLPPTFLTFIYSSGNPEPSDVPSEENPFAKPAEDPFGADEPQVDGSQYVYLKKRDPRVPASSTDRVLDLRKPLANMGVGFKENEFAVFNMETDTLYLLAEPLNQDLTAAIVTPAGSWGSHRSISIEAHLIESKIKPTADLLDKQEKTTLSRNALETLPGQSNTLILGPIHFDVEAQIDANDSIIEARFELTRREGKETTFETKTAVTLEVGVPQVVQSTFADGKWRSLIITGTIINKPDTEKENQ